MLACPEYPARDRRLAHAQRTGGFAVGESEHIDSYQRKTAILRQRRNRRVHLLHLKRPLRLTQLSRIGRVVVIRRGHRHRPAARGATAAEERVAQHPHHVVQLVIAAQDPRPCKHVSERLLNEILGILARAAQRPRGAIKTVHVLRQRLWVQGTHFG